jgi:hypothetical protein
MKDMAKQTLKWAVGSAWLVCFFCGVVMLIAAASQIELTWPEPTLDAPVSECPCGKDAGGKCHCPGCDKECMKP